MDILGKLFGSPARIKIMRLFLLNPLFGFEIKDISTRSRVKQDLTRKELNLLIVTGFIKKKSFFKEIESKKTKVKSKSKSNKKVKIVKPIKKRIDGYFLNQDFKYLTYLKPLLIDDKFFNKNELVSKLKNIGKIKFLVASGIFIKNEDSRADLLLVVDDLKKNSLDEAVKIIESEIGKELSYAVFDTQEFTYRYSMYDKLIKDILDYPHEKIIDTFKFNKME